MSTPTVLVWFGFLIVVTIWTFAPRATVVLNADGSDIVAISFHPVFENRQKQEASIK
jgi:hypothetical protein